MPHRKAGMGEPAQRQRPAYTVVTRKEGRAEGPPCVLHLLGGPTAGGRHPAVRPVLICPHGDVSLHCSFSYQHSVPTNVLKDTSSNTKRHVLEHCPRASLGTGDSGHRGGREMALLSSPPPRPPSSSPSLQHFQFTKWTY